MNTPTGNGADGRIRVKVRATLPLTTRLFPRQFPGSQPRWGRCDFLFDPDCRDYDWLVVYDDLRPAGGKPTPDQTEILACHPLHTLLSTTEPPAVKHYGKGFTAQFGHVLTSQPEWALPHPRRIFSQTGLPWFYGTCPAATRSFETLEAARPEGKQQDVSMVATRKAQWHTLHRRRFEFQRHLRERMPEIQVYGRGFRPVDDKAEALDPFRYHIAVENYVGIHHWTEKLADPFLGLALPFYVGCTNAADYFPADSFIPLDIDRPDEAIRIIRAAVAGGEYEKRLPAIVEARRRVLYEHNYFALLARTIEARHDRTLGPLPGAVIHSRHTLRRQRPWVAVADTLGKITTTLQDMARR
ncbi:MAG: glycosyltransferase family 10 [Pseudomonadota bacterium]